MAFGRIEHGFGIDQSQTIGATIGDGSFHGGIISGVGEPSHVATRAGIAEVIGRAKLDHALNGHFMSLDRHITARVRNEIHLEPLIQGGKRRAPRCTQMSRGPPARSWPCRDGSPPPQCADLPRIVHAGAVDDGLFREDRFDFIEDGPGKAFLCDRGQDGRDPELFCGLGLQGQRCCADSQRRWTWSQRTFATDDRS